MARVSKKTVPEGFVYVNHYELRSFVREGIVIVDSPGMASPRDVYNAMKEFMAGYDREHLIVIYLNSKNRITGFSTVSIGDMTSSIVAPALVFKPAILAGAASIMLIHNHPSGDPKCSPSDVAVTARIQEGGELLGIQLLDHIIIGEGRFYSMMEKGDMVHANRY